MKTFQLHGTDLMLSAMGLGTVKFGRNEGVKYPEAFELPTDSHIEGLLEVAQSNGINVLDTAPAYGESEERLGRLLGSARDDWHIFSKAGECFEGGESFFDFSQKGIEASLERSLRLMRTDRLEGVLIHSDGDDLRILNESGAMEALKKARDAGKVRAIGISSKTAEGGLRAIELGLDIVMVTYHQGYEDEAAVLDAAAAAGRSVFFKKALGSGWLAQSESEEVRQRKVADAFRFLYARQPRGTVIVGTLSEAHLRENAAAVAAAFE